jgi:ABC-type hemin transport system substrate-binding protein
MKRCVEKAGIGLFSYLLFVLVLGFASPGVRAADESHEGFAKKRGSDQPQRVVSMGPNITETVFSLGCGQRLVAVTDFCIYPPFAANLAKTKLPFEDFHC